MRAGARHLVAALDHATGAVLGQLAVTANSNEIPALRDLIDTMDIIGAVVSADAMHCQRESAGHITTAGGHYLLTVKANQPARPGQGPAVQRTCPRPARATHVGCEA